MLHRFPILLAFLAVLSYSVFGLGEINSYSERSSFASVVDDQKVLDFEGIAANSGFVQFNREGRFATAGIEFRPGGGARFGPGAVMIVGAWYQAGPAFETTSGAKLIWQPPNQPGNAYLDITLPSGITAVGTDLWAAQPSTSPVEVAVYTSDGGSRTVTVNTLARPSAAFIGFTSDSSIMSLRIKPAKGQTGLVIDNFTFGRSSNGAAEQRVDRPRSEVNAANPRPAVQPQPAPALDRPRTAWGGNAKGTIAYVRGGTEIRVISPDGTNDHRLWTHPDLHEGLGLYEIAWRPDGKELAFSSSHAAAASLYHADIYAIRPDGSGLRKLTNAPDHSELARYRTGTVTVNVRNSQAAGTTPGTFIIYVAGADEPQQVTIPAGAGKALVFKSVADLGAHAQPVVAMFGKSRWFAAGVDVQAGRNVTVPVFNISGEGVELFGAFRPVWRSDGSRISYRSGHCVVSNVPSNPEPGKYSFDPLFAGKNPLGSCTWDWGPTTDTADQIIYTENGSGGSSIFKIAEGRAHPGTKLTEYSNLDYQLLYDLRWLPDATGLLYSNVTLMRDSANIFRFDFAGKQVTQVTNLKNEFARAFSVSPDGRSVVFERCKSRDEDKSCDLWIADSNGGGLRLLVKNGLSPSWGR